MNCDSTQVCIILYVFDVQIVFPLQIALCILTFTSSFLIILFVFEEVPTALRFGRFGLESC